MSFYNSSSLRASSCSQQALIASSLSMWSSSVSSTATSKDIGNSECVILCRRWCSRQEQISSRLRGWNGAKWRCNIGAFFLFLDLSLRLYLGPNSARHESYSSFFQLMMMVVFRLFDGDVPYVYIGSVCRCSDVGNVVRNEHPT